jgi:hypothetical protein
VESDGIFDAFDGETPEESPDGDIVSTIEDDSGGQPQGNPFDQAAAPAASEDAGDRQSPAAETGGQREMETDRETGEEQKPFAPSKSPAAAVLNDGPHKLNKQLILRIGVGTLAVFIIGATFRQKMVIPWLSLTAKRIWAYTSTSLPMRKFPF